jgi:hypothetical protein
MTNRKGSGFMVSIKDAVRELAFIETHRSPDPCTPPELTAAWDKVEEAGKADPIGVWDILRHGTEDEFSALCNCLPEIGGEFDGDDASREIVRIAKQRLVNARDCDNIMAGIRGAFGSLFDKFWNEAPPAAKARTLKNPTNKGASAAKRFPATPENFDGQIIGEQTA